MVSTSVCWLLLLTACVALLVGGHGAASAPWQPMPFGAPLLMGFMRPRRAPLPPPGPRPPTSLGGIPGHGPGPGAPPPPGNGAYAPPRSLTFSGYFSGAGSPQGDPYAFSWGPAIRSAEEGAPEVAPVAEQELPGPAAAVPQDPAAPEEPAAIQPDAPESSPGLADADGEAVFAPRRKAGSGGKNKPGKPSYPVPDSPGQQPPRGPPEDGADDRGGDRGGYGTINAYFPFMFGAGWPMGGQQGPTGPSGPRQHGPRGYGAPNPPSSGYGGGNGGSGGSGGNGGNGGSNTGSNGGGNGQPGEQGSAGSPYYPVAIANSFSTGRNAMASSTATAYGGRS